jgi:hypothetical protein
VDLLICVFIPLNMNKWFLGCHLNVYMDVCLISGRTVDHILYMYSAFKSLSVLGQSMAVVNI